MSSTLTSADMVRSRSSTRVHAPPGGKTSISFGSDNLPKEIQKVVEKAVPPPAPSQEASLKASRMRSREIIKSDLNVGLAIAEGSPLKDAVLCVATDLGSQTSICEVSDILLLPYATQTLMKSNVQCVIVLGQLLETDSWCSKEIVQSVHSSLISLSLTEKTPIVFGINYERIASNQIDNSALRLFKSAQQICGQSTDTSGNYSNMSTGTRSDSYQMGSMDITRDDANSEIVEPMMETLREALKKRGNTGICELARRFRISDVDGSGTLNKEEVGKIFSSLKVGVDPMNLDEVLDYFDKNSDGYVSYNEFLVGIRGPINDRRLKLVLAAFGLMDKDKNGVLDARDLRTRYDVSRHPGVLNGNLSKDQAMAEFLSTFDIQDKNGKVTPMEWIEYYTNVSASIDMDDYFELMMRNTWRMSGGEGFTANTANRRVLVTHPDGKQTVEEIKNDLGVSGVDVNAMMENLKKQGLKPTKLEMYGSSEKEEKKASAKSSSAAPSPRDSGVSPTKRQAPGGKSNLVLG
mmetsp:Transcript_2769/g.4144  ORF Transcript_2769/g.4144 Transcript_2769/m.4144 type:complete len:520 (+) Transcript_2769:67-1626(+)